MLIKYMVMLVQNTFLNNRDFLALLLPGSSDGKESGCNVGDLGLIPEWIRSPREENGYPSQYYCLENSMDRGVWWATVSGVAKSWT